MTIHSFPPVTTPQARILILGSMPGEKSLTENQYYAHPRNSFWPVMSAIFQTSVETYDQRLALIHNNNLALWDVLQACVRKGSLDQAIEKDSIVPNNFAAFLTAHSHIKDIFFNGTAAHDMFMRQVWPNLPDDIAARLSLHKLPSTSPAMASLSRADKTQQWQDAFKRAQAPRNHHAGGASPAQLYKRGHR